MNTVTAADVFDTRCRLVWSPEGDKASIGLQPVAKTCFLHQRRPAAGQIGAGTVAQPATLANHVALFRHTELGL